MTTGKPSLIDEVKPMLRLAVPVVVAELGWMAMGIVDTMMVGRIDAESIGAVSIGRALFMLAMVFGIGLLLGMDTVISNAFGAGRLGECGAFLVHGAYLAVAISIPVMLAPRLLLWPLGSFGVDPAVLEPAATYLKAVSWSALPLLLYMSFRRYLQAINVVRPVMFALLSANVVNVIANWVLIFGRLGAPALGVEGAAWATVLCSWYLAVALLGAILVHDRGEGSALLRVSARPDPARFGRLLALGFPAALQLLLEVGVFALATTLAGRLEPSSLAAHQIALSAASVTYMVPLGISAAAAVRVGQALGRGDPDGAARAGWVALWFGAGFMSLAALSFVLFPRWIVRGFTSDERVIASGAALLFVAAVFQLFDGVQVVATGALRGAGDTRTPLAWNLVGYWLLGLPIGYFLAFRAGWGAVGLWIGLSVGLIVVGTVLLDVWRRRVRSWG